MEINSIKKDVISYDEMVITDSSGALITGLIDNDFTRDLYDPNGDEVSSEITVLVTELGNGKYRTNFTPNTIGNWVLTLYHSTYFSAGKSANYSCVINLNDDIPGAVWDVNLNEHVSSSRSTGYRIKHISAASTTRIFNRGIWTKKEKEELFKQITSVYDDLIIIKDKDENVNLINSMKDVKVVVNDVKYLVDNLQIIDHFKEIKDYMTLKAQDDLDINFKLNNQIDELKDKFIKLLSLVEAFDGQKELFKSLCDKTDVKTIINNVTSSNEKDNKVELLLSNIYNYLEELTSLFVKTLSIDKLESVVKEGNDEKIEKNVS